jgi:hypothetical protein
VLNRCGYFYRVQRLSCKTLRNIFLYCDTYILRIPLSLVNKLQPFFEFDIFVLRWSLACISVPSHSICKNVSIRSFKFRRVLVATLLRIWDNNSSKMFVTFQLENILYFSHVKRTCVTHLPDGLYSLLLSQTYISFLRLDILSAYLKLVNF